MTASKTANGDARLTQQEKEELGTLTSDLAIQAIEAGDKEKAKELINRLVAETKGIHDSYLIWITAMQSFIYREYGEDVYLKSQKDAFAQAIAPWSKMAAAQNTFRDRVNALAYKLRTHAMPLKIEEDDEKVVMMMDGCGSGARLVENGFYDPAQGGKGAKVADASPMTFGRKDFPIYCTHCAIGQMMALEGGTKPEDMMGATVPGKEIGKDLCQFHLYKAKGSFPKDHLKTLQR